MHIDGTTLKTLEGLIILNKMSSYNTNSEGPQEIQTSPKNNTSASISVDNNLESRLGIINVMFTMPKEILSWAAGTFYDGKIEVITDSSSMNAAQRAILMPNSERYRCIVCGATRSTADWDYTTCKGTKDVPHSPEYRIPVGWFPLCSRTGISYLIAQLQMGINPNIQTANFGKNINDIKNKADLDSKLTNLAVNMAISIMGSLLSNKNNYADWLMASPNYELLPQVFNVPFLESTMTSLAANLLASYTKGKNMEAVGKVLETRARIEQEITNKTERNAQEQQITQNNSNKNTWGIFEPLKPRNR